MPEQSYDNKIIHSTKIGFIGLGKLGMTVAETIGKKGFEVNGYDVQPRSSDIINIKNNLKDAVVDRDIIFIAVPTPHVEGYDGRTPTSHMPPMDFDYTEVKNVLKQLNALCSNEQVISLISTVLPGTVRKQLDPIYEPSNIVYNPYLIAMGTVEWDTRNPEMVMIGTESGWEGKGCTRRTNKLTEFYNNLCDNPPRVEAGKWEEIESMKIFYNTFISTKLALVNMIQDVSNKLGNMDVDKVTQALAKSTQRIASPAYMKAGMGDGGACHPRDNIALRWLAKDLDLGYDLFEGIMTARERQAENMAREILKHGRNVYFTSDSYKPGSDLVDGSYSLLVQHYVIKHGGQIVHGFDNPVEVIVRVHESDQITTDDKTIIFDPWRSYPKAANVVHYGKCR